MWVSTSNLFPLPRRKKHRQCPCAERNSWPLIFQSCHVIMREQLKSMNVRAPPLGQCGQVPPTGLNTKPSVDLQTCDRLRGRGLEFFWSGGEPPALSSGSSVQFVDRDSSVGMATRYGLDCPGDRTRWGARHSLPVQTGPGAHPAYYKRGTGSLFQG